MIVVPRPTLVEVLTVGRKCSHRAGPRASTRARGLGRTLHDLHDGVLSQAYVAADEAIGQPLLVHLEHPLRFLVGGTLTWLAAELDATGLGRSQGRSRMRSRSNSAMPAMMVRISLPVEAESVEG